MRDTTELIHAAQMVREKAYAPYSKFKVGAAVGTAQGKTFTGCNVENASYGLTVCAERNALGAAIAAGEKKFDLLVVASEDGVPPCGACRQVIWELCGEIPVILVDQRGNTTRTTSRDLLPGAFNQGMLHQ
ncbi:MAG: cytidine deaminase [Candidatus Marinimicrobia bacterium]|nr:cytidine deaminase [Candidatus Neomarinimicrobiota bacterium]MCF7839505.1 cytidine deaminase [Candidatus Neomarinimicrobiota bacterium]MCF7902037.1 cytidine deaminase [Candidatus Neomarinimicrobiota bacterium]